MKNIMKRSLALVMALVMCLSLLPVSHVHAEDSSFYTYSSDGKYIYNWGTRGTTATFLSPNAEAFYTGSNAYSVLSANSGGTGTSDAPNSALYDALQTLMANAHTTKTSYADTRDLYQYTDCQQSGAWESGKISSFYSGVTIGPEWDSGATWNREHTWPNSKGLEGDDENDIMMLRPTSSSENSSRGNMAYGQSAGYFHPNADSGYTLDLRGDVARIFLYTYVRWGIVNGNGTYSTWGSNGVIESLDVLLAWMEADPVDTWELGRNDSVQAITGTRNVFVDYPEYAFLLFGEAIPSGMVTPSGEAAGGSCAHNFVAGEPVAPTCTAEGYTLYTCSLCSASYKGDKQPMVDHTYADGACSVCGAKEPVELVVIDLPATGVAYKFGMYQEKTYTPAVYYLAGGMSGYYMATTTEQTAAIDVYLEAAEGGYYLYTNIDGVKTYINMVASGTYVNGAYETTASTVYTYDLDSKTLIAAVNGGNYWFGTRNDMQYTTVGPCDVTQGTFVCRFYGEAGSGAESTCTHANTTVTGAVEATCTTEGNTGKITCSDCGVTVTLGQVIPAKGHSYENGACSVCGEAAPAGLPKEGVAYKFGMIQGNVSATDVYYLDGTVSGYYMGTTTDETAAVNVYLEAAEGGYYLYTELNGVKTYINMVVSGTYVNGAFETTASTVYTYDATNDILVSQVNGAAYCFGTRNDMSYTTVGPVKVEYNGFWMKLYPVCAHTNTTVEGAAEAACTAPGHTGKTVCGDCGTIVNAGEVIPMLEHDYVDGVCSVCGQQETDAPAERGTITASLSFADKANRTVFTTSQQVWEENGIKLTNDKASSTSNVADYANPARFYKNSKITVEYPEMTKIAFTCNSAAYANSLKTSIGTPAGVTVTVSGSVVTVEFAELQDSFVFTLSDGQVRMNSLEITAMEPCAHANTTVEGAVEATCTEDGHTGKTVCGDCGIVISEGEVITAPGHSMTQHEAKEPTCSEVGHEAYEACANCDYTTYVEIPVKDHHFSNGVCSYCQMKLALSFADKANRTVFTTSQQVWEENGIKLTNDKAASTSDVADYANPARFYASSKLTIEYPGMKQIVFVCNASKYVTALQNSLASVTGITVAVDGNNVTVTFAQAQDSFVIEKLTAQVRLDSLQIVNGETCAHENTTVEGAAAATCTEPGHTGKTVCNDCGETVSEGEVIEALGHDHDAVVTAPTCTEPGYTTYTCDLCGDTYVADETEALGHSITQHEAKEPTCTAVGWEAYESCANCNYTTYVEIPAKGHDFDEGACTVCKVKLTLSFADKANRTEFTTSKQVWEENGIKLTNDKAASTNNVADYANPARFYAGSKLTIEYPKMTQIEFTCNNASYATVLNNSIGTQTGVTVSVSGSKVTVTFDQPQDSFVIAKLTAQVRMNSLQIINTNKEPASGEFNGVTFRGDNEGLSVELQNLLAHESVQVKVYAGETLLTTVSWRDEYIQKGVFCQYLTASVRTGEEESTQWAATQWIPTYNVVPNKYELYIDGTLMDTMEHDLDAEIWNALTGVRPAAPDKYGKNVTPNLIQVVCDSDPNHEPMNIKWQHQSTEIYPGAVVEWNEELGTWTIKVRIDSVSVYYVWMHYIKSHNEIRHSMVDEDQQCINTYLKWDEESQLWVHLDEEPIEVHVTCVTAPVAPTTSWLGKKNFQIQVNGDLDGDGIYGENGLNNNGLYELYTTSAPAEAYTIGEVYGSREEGFFVDVTITLEDGDIFLTNWIEKRVPGEAYVYDWEKTQKTFNFTLKYAGDLTTTLQGDGLNDWVNAATGQGFGVIGEAFVELFVPAAPKQENVTDKLVSIICDSDGERHETVYGKWYPLGHCSTTSDIVWNEELGTYTVDVRIGSLYIMYVDQLEDANGGTIHELVEDITTVYGTLKWDAEQELWVPMEAIELHTTCRTAPMAPAYNQLKSYQIKVNGNLDGDDIWGENKAPNNGVREQYSTYIPENGYTLSEVYGSREEGFFIDVTVTLADGDVYLANWMSQCDPCKTYVYDWTKTEETVTFTLKYNGSLTGTLYGDRHASNTNYDWVLASGKTYGVVAEAYAVVDPNGPTYHEMTSVVTAPTCTEPGYTTHTCDLCGDVIVDSETEALGHAYEHVVTAPTCTESGYTTHTCDLCGDSYVDGETEALGHDWSDWTVTKKPTAYSKGEQFRSCLREGCSCEESETIPMLEKLATPEITGFENVMNGIKITWGKVTGAELYRVYVLENGKWKNLGNTTGTSFVYTAAESGETYTFTVRCVNADRTAFTSDYNTTGWSQTFVAAPMITKLESAANGVKITWGAVAGAEKYRVYVRSTTGWKTLAITTGTSFTWTGAETGETYIFNVRCVAADGATFASYYNTDNWTYKYNPTPEITKLESTVTGVKVTWNAIKGAEQYRVFVKTSKGWATVGNTEGTTFTWTGAEAGKTYIFTVRCVDAEGNYISAYNGNGWSHKYYPAPVVTKQESTPNGFKLTWGAINGAGKYRVYVKNAEGVWTKIGDTTATSFTWTGAKTGERYTFTVRCLNAEASAFVSSYNANGWTYVYSPVPELTKLESTGDGVKLTWGAINGAEKYRLFIKTETGWKTVGNTEGTSFTWTGAETGKSYIFSIRCVSADGKKYTSSSNTEGWKYTYYPIPELTKLESTSEGVKLTWGAINGAEKYRLFIKTETGWKTVGNTEGTSFTWTGAESGVTYTFSIRCVSADGKKYTSSSNTTGWTFTHK